ncbi:Zn-dependent hydrolase [Stutzerimonas stutzeri]|uniref:Zn-dependent hydrolase n=1 Tax=Stutzerimonas stutzeri TaxID=316 RepID=UPI0016396CAE|nr:Zn-dependent hydrolase [Stutzerimonas stutzeri]
MNAHKVWTLGGRIRRLGALLLLALLAAVTSANAVAEGLRFSLVRTAQSESGDFLLRRGGWQPQPQTQHIAILIEHRGTRLLFGTGLGRQIDEQLDAELPWRTKRYGEVQPVRDQLERDGLAIDRIVLGCVRWEHASGLVDFPGVPVLASPDSLDYLQTATPPAVLPSQFRHPIDWQPLQFDPRPYFGHAQSLDLFGDGQLVLVPLAGHGAVGLYLTLADGRRFFFRGDRPEQDVGGAQGIATLRDADTQASLGYYPHWVQ